MSNERKVKCPHCGLFALYSTENIYRPFCSERCRLIDLGQWADGKYAIPVTSSPGYQDGAFETSDEDAVGDGGRSNSDLHPEEEE